MPFPSPPRGLKAIPWRLPIFLYRSGLGWFLGKGFLLLRHIGRKTGKTRYAVLEIIHSDPDAGSYYVVSGFGTMSDWYQNIRGNSKAEIQIGKDRFSAQAQQLAPSQGADILQLYSKNKPGNLETLNKILGYEIEFSPEGIREFGRQIPVIQFSIMKEE